MSRRRRGRVTHAASAGLVALLMALALSACGKPAAPPQTEPSGSGVTFRPSPPNLLDVCGRVQQRPPLSVLCPTRLPAASLPLVVRHADLESDDCAYLLDINSERPSTNGPFHLLLGGRCHRLSLASRGGRWPAGVIPRNELRLVPRAPRDPEGDTGDEEVVRPTVLQRLRVRGERALLLRLAPYPDGGLHGGHVVLLWNERDAAYALSAHFPDESAQAPIPAQTAVLVELAEAMGRVADTRAAK